MHFKYQSASNSDWFLGFDQTGNPIRAVSPTKHTTLDGEQLNAINIRANLSESGRANSDNIGNTTSASTYKLKLPDKHEPSESTQSNHNETSPKHSPASQATTASLVAINNPKRCYQFTKLSLFLTDTEEFPEAYDVLAARERKKSMSDQHNDTFVSSGLKQSSSDSIHSRRSSSSLASSLSLLQRTTGNSSLNKSSSVTIFDQSELIDMAKFRNVLRHRLLKSGKSPLLLKNI